MIARRAIVQALALAPLSCATKAKTPLDHLYGKGWVAGAYELYAKEYAEVGDGAESRMFGACDALARRGVVALDGLQARGVPFYVRAAAGERRFTLERKVPARLTLTADMTARDRAAATLAWEEATAHAHTDYEEIRRLDGALTTLLGELRRVRGAIDEGKLEGYRITRQLAPLAEGAAPFELPYQVTTKDYEDVLYLLLDGLDLDATRLAGLEASIAAVGLAARATDAGSGSLAANLRKVLLAVANDASEAKPRDARYPGAEERRARATRRGRELATAIRASEGYAAWEKREDAKRFAAIGSVLATLDAMTGLPTSAIFQQVLDAWSGDADYLSYLRTLAAIVPGGGAVAKALRSGVERTERVRDAIASLGDAGGDALAAAATKKGAGLLNVASPYAVSRAKAQLVFYADAKDALAVEEALRATRIGG